MSTDELLKQATPRPWSHAEGYKDEQYRTRDVHGCHIGVAGKVLCGYAVARIRFDQVNEQVAEANAELLTRAVNSFEAMRGALKSAKQAIEDGRGSECYIGSIEDEIDAALALADGKSESL